MTKEQLTTMRYAGVLKLLEECSPHVPEDTREMIEAAFEHACEDGSFTWRRFGDRCEIEVAATFAIPMCAA